MAEPTTTNAAWRIRLADPLLVGLLKGLAVLGIFGALLHTSTPPLPVAVFLWAALSVGAYVAPASAVAMWMRHRNRRRPWFLLTAMERRERRESAAWVADAMQAAGAR